MNNIQPAKEIDSDSKAAAAMLEGSKVLVMYRDGEIADYGGPIESLSEDAIKINGMHYTKTACRFYVR